MEFLETGRGQGTASGEAAERGGIVARGPAAPGSARAAHDARSRHQENVARVPSAPAPGRVLVTRRAIADVVRAAALGSYGVTGLQGGPVRRLLSVLGLPGPGIRVDVRNGVDVDLRLTVSYGLPVAEVARQVDSAVRYAVRKALAQEIRGLRIHVGGLELPSGGAPAARTHGTSRTATGRARPPRRGIAGRRRRPPGDGVPGSGLAGLR